MVGMILESTTSRIYHNYLIRVTDVGKLLKFADFLRNTRILNNMYEYKKAYNARIQFRQYWAQIYKKGLRSNHKINLEYFFKINLTCLREFLKKITKIFYFSLRIVQYTFEVKFVETVFEVICTKSRN